MSLFYRKKEAILIDLGLNYLSSTSGLHEVGHFPFGILNIASFFEINKIPVRVLALDYYFNSKNICADRNVLKTKIKEILLEEINRNKPILIGISVSYTIQLILAFEILQIVKEINPHIISVLGGSHVTFLAELTLKSSAYVDVIVRGEGEWALCDFFSCLKKKGAWENIPGISFLKNGQYYETNDRDLGDLSELPPINFGLLPANYYKNKQVNIAATRGCYYRCKFCTDRIFWKNTLRSTPVDKIIKETRDLFEKYKISCLSFEDSMIDIQSDYFRLLSHKLQNIGNRNLGVLVARIDSMNKEALITIKKAGFKSIIYGLESGSETILKYMNKTNDLQKTPQVFKLTRENNLKVGAFWIVGHPGDSVIESEKSISYMKYLYQENLLNWSRISRFIPYPGSDYFNHPEKYGIHIMHFNWEQWIRHVKDGVCYLDDFKEQEIQIAYENMLKTSFEYEL